MSFLSKPKQEQEAHKEAGDIIAKATRKAEELLVEATREAKVIIEQTQSFREDLQKSLKDDIAYQAEEFSKAYQGMVPELKKYYQGAIDEQVKVFKGQFEEIAGEMRASLKGELDKFNILLQEQSGQALGVVKQELEEYKKQQMAKLDEKARTVLQKTVSEVIGKTISATDHQELIREALERAKKEGVFGK